MACSLAAVGRLGAPPDLLGHSRGLSLTRSVAHEWPTGCRSTAARGRTSLRVEARDRQRRLLSLVLSAPQRVEVYFRSALWRRWLWAGISVATGFYAGNIATLSFGALAINDVFAAVITLLFCEVVTHLYYTDTSGSLTLWFLNCFKMGLIAALLADAAKLGS